MAIITKQQLITPAIAQKMLANMRVNRPVRAHHVDELMLAIQSGNFSTTHQGIAFNEFGQLMDGQHRLWAIIKADIPVLMMVSTGLPDDSFKHIDTQSAKRSVTDAIGGDRKVNEIAQAILKILSTDSGHESQSPDAVAFMKDLFADELLAVREKLPTNKKGVPNSLAAALAVLIAQRPKERSWVTEQLCLYHAQDYKGMAPAVARFAVKMYSGDIPGTDRKRIFCTAIKVFQQSNANASYTRTSEEAAAKILTDARAMLAHRRQEHGV